MRASLRSSAAPPGGARAPDRRALVTQIAPLDEVLRAHASHIGRDWDAYRNHTYRVANICLALAPAGAETFEKVALAAAFHDLGIWTDGTFDYIDPSVRATAQHLATTGRSEWMPEIVAMIREHHKITPWRGPPGWLVEPFRKADWVDVSWGLVTHGLPRRFLSDVFAQWPDCGFHRRLVQLTLSRLRRHPLDPLPMFRL